MRQLNKLITPEGSPPPTSPINHHTHSPSG
ncbi:15.8g5 protein [Bracoviriform inaniti]|uniref:15.8g5 protein n=1 Tax=Bracoviriform inaniti TaxID=36344 RepID=A8E0Z4_9VIRU|nr:15.8g5 protein [Bracoviriform inaniti]CAO98964.1 15.8g5 protein [Bracoviriform inaniti]